MVDDPDFKPIEYDPEQPIQTLYTSGTTGKPKGAQITGANVIANLNMVEKIFPVQEGDKTLCVLPLFHVFALNGVLNSAVRHRTTIVLHTKFELEPAVKSLVEDGVCVFAGVPTMYFYILKHPKINELKFPKLRHCVVGGAPMPVEVIDAVRGSDRRARLRGIRPDRDDGQRQHQSSRPAEDRLDRHTV